MALTQRIVIHNKIIVISKPTSNVTRGENEITITNNIKFIVAKYIENSSYKI